MFNLFKRKKPPKKIKRDWYYEKVKPFEHNITTYVPLYYFIRIDLNTGFKQKIIIESWCNDNNIENRLKKDAINFIKYYEPVIHIIDEKEIEKQNQYEQQRKELFDSWKEIHKEIDNF